MVTGADDMGRARCPAAHGRRWPGPAPRGGRGVTGSPDLQGATLTR
ncbi:hypothetical protein SCATT_07510 [Streptantibioticus cattleyicolor NRRL 8057 = DSM 46488]|uniref:Uncharacterized protein n=1 Tax=Streptantibioticus cattleyicolor (strain ATCC 35852 / DSM 46488 / JCM 4925 / NBRC 14057 / NRRL 8057) TaxID=1003195 RepID=G8WW29_STREN|nr:hypothetical protein SCATT_07510 [Streptantibioticus cattleyicolor NRRL 8057 = DSM 46488]